MRNLRLSSEAAHEVAYGPFIRNGEGLHLGVAAGELEACAREAAAPKRLLANQRSKTSKVTSILGTRRSLVWLKCHRSLGR